MAEEKDPAAEFFDENLHLTMMQTERFIELIARARENRMREQEQQVRADTRDKELLVREQRDAARVKYDKVYSPSFWNNAKGQELADTVETALFWRDRDPKAQVACQKIDSEMQTRYGVSLAYLEASLNKSAQERSAREAHEEEREYWQNDASFREEEAQNTTDPAEQERAEEQAAQSDSFAADSWDNVQEREAREAFYESEFEQETAHAAIYADRARSGKPSQNVSYGHGKKNLGKSRALGINQGKSHELER